MTGFAFISSVDRFGFSDGFWCGSATKTFGLDEREYPGHPTPSLVGKTLYWKIVSAEVPPWAQYIKLRDAWRKTVTQRKDEILRCLPDSRAWMWNSGDDLHLNITAPPREGFAAFITAAALAERKIVFECWGASFAAPGVDNAAVPSVEGFLLKEEPLFLGSEAYFRIAQVDEKLW